VATQRGELDQAIPLLEDAPRICRRLPDSYLWIEAYGLDSLCAVAVEQALPSAARWIEELEQLAGRAGFRELLARTLVYRRRLGAGSGAAVIPALHDVSRRQSNAHSNAEAQRSAR